MAACDKLVVKLAKFDGSGETRRFTCQLSSPVLSFEGMCARAAEMFDLPTHLKFLYNDPEGDCITVLSDEEMAEAVSLATQSAPPILRLTVQKHEHTKPGDESDQPQSTGRHETDQASPREKATRANNPADLGAFIEQLSAAIPGLVTQLPASLAASVASAASATSAGAARAAATASAASAGAARAAAAAASAAPAGNARTATQRVSYGEDGVHPGVKCDRSGMCPIVGNRYNLRGHDWDLCEAEFLKLPLEEQAKYVKMAPPVWARAAAAQGTGASAAAAQSTAAPAPSEEKPVGCHPGVRCDRSGMCPIVGNRYNLRGHDYDLCEAEFDRLSEADKAQYVKIPPRRGAWARAMAGSGCPGAFGGPGNMFGCPGTAMPSWVPPGPHPARFGPGPPAWNACGRAHKEPKLAARFIRELSIFDGTQMAPATKFTKIWRLKNVGECPWPEGTRILFVGGDQMGSDPSAVAAPTRVMPGDEVDVALDLVAPTELGRYVGYWRLAGPYCRRKFGHRVWCHIHVVDPRMTVQPPSEQEMAEVMAKQEELRKEMGQEMDADAAGDGDGDAAEDKPEDKHEEPPAQPSSQPLADKPSDAARTADELSPTVAAAAADDDDADGADADGAQSDGSFVEVGDDVDGMHPPAGISATVAAQLGAMGFTDEETVRLVMQRNHSELEACARDLASLSEWEHIVDDLAEMGFEDRSLNMEVLLRHDGSLKGAVKELVAHAASK